jgi:plasmid stabilization system protein ParE
MRVEFHPAVQNDFNAALDYYEAEGGPHLADRFEEEVRSCVAAIKAGPTRFSFYQKSDRFRRIRLKSFPYIIVYRENAAAVRVSVLKHERRHPRFGMARR